MRKATAVFISSHQGGLSEVSGRETEIGASDHWPYPMGHFRSFAPSSLRGGAAGLQGCDSRRKGKARGPPRKHPSSALHTPRDLSGGSGRAGGEDAAGRMQGSSVKRPTRGKEEKQCSLLISVGAFSGGFDWEPSHV